jgi:aminodeoxyfutalosine deaminase
MAFALKARVVFPVDQPPIDGGVVTIDGGRIVDVGTQTVARQVNDLGDVALLPGLVNAHTHLEFSYLQKPLGTPGMRLVDWIRLVIAERRDSHRDHAETTRFGIKESWECGATTIGDIASLPAVSYANLPPTMVLFAEVIGFSTARAESAFAAAVAYLGGLSADSWAELGISPHAPYTVSPALVRRLVELANSRVLPVAMHVAESAEELELLATGGGPFQELLDERSMWDAEAIPRGGRPLDYLRMLAEAPRALVIHGNYLDAEERAFLAANSERMSLVYCPRTHAYFAHPPYPLAELLDAGVRVALGTDSRASNPDLDLLAETRYVARKFRSINPQQILRMGTLSGAEAVGREWEAGSITPGKFANLISVPIQNRRATSVDDVLHDVLLGDQKPSGVWVLGCQEVG